MARLRIIHTSDLHNRLEREGAEALAFLRETTGALLLDSGDAVGAGNIWVRRAEPILELMNLAGYHAMAVGNREFYFRKRGLLHKTAAAKFAVLSANLRAREGDLGHIRPWTVLEAGGLRVGVFGLTREMIAPGCWLGCFSDVRFVPWREAVTEAIEALRERVDLLVALSHLGTRRERALAAEFAGVDLILGGHAHDDLEERAASGTVISHPGHHGTRAVLLEIERAPGGGLSVNRRVASVR
ncbi:MAG TPA: metallophosphoesterase [Armatimonadota bacterium]|nr:metallophosphoesterase [Armatimonadota bacterium]